MSDVMKSSVTDVTDPAKLSKLAGSTTAKPPVCELTSLSFACLHPGWIFPLVLEQTQQRAQEGCGRAGECGRRGWHHQAPVVLTSQHEAACPHLWEPTKLLCTAAQILQLFGHPRNSQLFGMSGTSTSITPLCMFNHSQAWGFILPCLVEREM